MLRLATILALLAACGGKGKQDTANGGSGSGSAIYAKKFAVSWGIEPNGTAKDDVFLQTTDDAGRQTSYPLGTYDGVCKVITPGADMKAVTALACTSSTATVELDAVVRRDPVHDQVIVLKGTTPQGATPDPMAREQVLSVDMTPGAAVQVGA